MKSIAWWGPQILERDSEIDVLELPRCPFSDIGREAPCLSGFEKVFRALISERLDHIV